MKAGIYKTPDGDLIYVAKDRSITAKANAPESSWIGEKVSHRSKDDTVLIGDVRCTRHSDVPNGCTDHQGLVDSLYKTMTLKPGEKIEDFGKPTERVVAVPTPPGGEGDIYERAVADWRESFARSLRGQGFRMCHKASARKHRKKGNWVVPLGDGTFYWRRPDDSLYPYQREVLTRLWDGAEAGVKIESPVGLGKSGTITPSSL